MDIEKVARVVELIESSQLYEVTIANNEQSITVVNSLNQQGVNSPTETAEIVSTHNPKENDKENEKTQLRATYVGHVYLSEDDVTDNLVNKGDYVEKGQTVCFIDELTRLLPVVSDKDGIISDILVEDGQNIEYGQPIFNLEV